MTGQPDRVDRTERPVKSAKPVEVHSQFALSVALAPDGRNVATGGDTTEQIWDATRLTP